MYLDKVNNIIMVRMFIRVFNDLFQLALNEPIQLEHLKITMMISHFKKLQENCASKTIYNFSDISLSSLSQIFSQDRTLKKLYISLFSQICYVSIIICKI